MAEGARLESVCRGNSTEGSNPSVSALRDKSSQVWFVPFLFSGVLFDRTAIAAKIEFTFSVRKASF